jgi:hypothetical protein
MRAPGVDTTALAKALQTRGVLIEPGAPFFATADRHDPPPSEFYRLAYSSIPASRIGAGVALIGAAAHTSGHIPPTPTGPIPRPPAGPYRNQPQRDRAMKMTTEEAFVKTLQVHGIEHAFGIIGSAFMPISDLFPRAASPSGTAPTRGPAG